MKHSLQLFIQAQPTETSCGATCLAAVYDYWDAPLRLSVLIEEIGQLKEGGTLAAVLGSDALRRGFNAELISYDLQLFDPTWFDTDGAMWSSDALDRKLDEHRQAKLQRSDIDQARLHTATAAYREFLRLGGRVSMRQLDEHLITGILSDQVPILCGLSATYLYRESRERVLKASGGEYRSLPDDLAGDPQGHFVVLHGYDSIQRTVMISDPLHPNPLAPSHRYTAPLSRVASAIMLGAMTFDANLLIIVPESNNSSALQAQAGTE